MDQFTTECRFSKGHGDAESFNHFSGGYIFNTEAHPIDPAALECCSGASDVDIFEHLRSVLNTDNRHIDVEFKGDTISARLEEIETRRREEAMRRKLKELELQKLIDERHKKEREALRRKKELEEIRRQKKLLEASENLATLAENLTTEENIVTSTENVATIEPIRVDESVFEEKASGKADETVESKKSSDVEVTNTLTPGVPSIADSDDPNAHNDVVSVKVDLNHDPILNPYFSGVAQPVESIKTEPEPPVLIKKQSKDEATVSLSTEDKTRVAETLAPIEPIDILEALNKIVNTFVPLKVESKFDLEKFRDRVFLDNQYSVNKSWFVDHAVMSCPAKHFLERFSIQGEFFEKYE